MATSKIKAAEFIATLLHGVTKAHMLHLTQRGAGAYARHKALGELYEELGGLVDGIAEEYMGCEGVLSTFPGQFSPPAAPEAFVQELYEYVEDNRKHLGDYSHIQNSIDNVQTLLSTTPYKLKFLS